MKITFQQADADHFDVYISDGTGNKVHVRLSANIVNDPHLNVVAELMELFSAVKETLSNQTVG